MSTTSNNKLEKIYSNRRKKLLRQIRGEAALFTSANIKQIGRDLEYPFRQDSNFYYLTGLGEPESALLLLGKTKGPRSILFLRERDITQEKWVGERLGLKRAKRRMEIDLVFPIEDLHLRLPAFLTNTQVLHYGLGINPQIDSIVFSLFQTHIGPRLDFPHTLKDSRLLLSELRHIKDKHEIQALRHASKITAKSILAIAPKLGQMTSEQHTAGVLEAEFYKRGASGLAFPTIVASGKNATTLHHTPSTQPLWKRDLVLIDAGAEFQGYTGDISRTLPVSGKFSPEQAKIYDIVLAALESALTKAFPGSTMNAIHNKAVSTITKGLIDLGILKGHSATLIKEGAYKPFYMHRTGHWLGLDVHDIAPIHIKNGPQHSYSRPLVPGNVLTVEPGLYLDPRDESIPSEFRGIGIRIEEDVLITDRGFEVLSASIPRERTEIESILS